MCSENASFSVVFLTGMATGSAHGVFADAGISGFANSTRTVGSGADKVEQPVALSAEAASRIARKLGILSLQFGFQ